jgi:hypothetical protein
VTNQSQRRLPAPFTLAREALAGDEVAVQRFRPESHSTGSENGATTDVGRHPVAYCRAAGTTRISMTERLWQMRQTTTAEVRFDESNAAGFGSARPNGPPFWLLPGRAAIKFGCREAAFDALDHQAVMLQRLQEAAADREGGRV